jgi:hypothetical protein
MTHRPSPRDWLIAALLGLALGAIILGAGGRVAMRGVALLAGATPGFSLGGTMTVVFLGAVSGIAGALVLVALRFALPRFPLARGTAYWAFLVLVTLRGLNPVDGQRILLFMPLVVAYGVALQVASCRVARRRRAPPSDAGGAAGGWPTSDLASGRPSP